MRTPTTSRPRSPRSVAALAALTLAAPLALGALVSLGACTVAGPSMVAPSADDGGKPKGPASNSSNSNDPWANDGRDDTVDDTTGTDPGVTGTTGTTGTPGTTGSSLDGGADAASDGGMRDATSTTTPTGAPDSGPIDAHPYLVGQWHLTALTVENIDQVREYRPSGVYTETLGTVSRAGVFRNGDRENHFVIEVHVVGDPTVTTKEYCTYAMAPSHKQMSVGCRAIGYPSNASVAITDAQPPVWTLD